MGPKSKSSKDLDSKSPIQWICREWVGKLGSDELGNDYSGFKWHKIRIDWLYLMKIVLSTVWEDQFLNIILKVDYKNSSYCYNVSLLIPDHSPSGSFFYFILPSFFHPYLPRVGWIAGIDPCSISTFLKFLVVAVKLKITVQLSPPHKCDQLIRCRAFNTVVAAFSLDILGLPSILCFYDAYPYQ